MDERMGEVGMSRDDLTALVREGRITTADAKVIRRHRKQQQEVAQLRAEAEATKAAEEAEWRARVDETNRMAPDWAQFIMAHCPALGDCVVHDDWPLRHAVELVEEWTGCRRDCTAHRPLTAEEEAALFARLLELGGSIDEVVEVLEWNRTGAP
jgi:hypothetical protein